MKKSAVFVLAAAILCFSVSCSRNAPPGVIDVTVYNNTAGSSIKITDTTTGQVIENSLAQGSNKTYAITQGDCLTFELSAGGTISQCFTESGSKDIM